MANFSKFKVGRGLALVPVNDLGRVIGEMHHRAKLSDHEVGLVIALLAEGMPQRVVAMKMDISRRTVRDIDSGKIRGQPVRGYRAPHPRRVRQANVAHPDEFECPEGV